MKKLFVARTRHQHRDHRYHRSIGCHTAKTRIIQGMTTYKIQNMKPKINKTPTLGSRKHQLKLRTTRDRPPTRIQIRKIGNRNTTESYHNVSHTEKIPTILFLIYSYFNLFLLCLFSNFNLDHDNFAYYMPFDSTDPL
jgi:hypothetical protein